MYFKKFIYNMGIFVLSTFIVVACGGNTPASTEGQAHSETPAESPAAAEAPEPSASSDGVVEVSIEGNDLMQYNKKEIKVPAGSKVRLTLTHTGKLAKAAMGHNFVVLKPGTVLEDFATAAMVATETDYIPADATDSIVAHTKMVGGGESDTIEFDAPAAGEYDFLCTFPGHFALMQGKFIVE